MLSLGRTFCILVLLSSFSYANRKFFHIFTPYSMSNNGDALTCSISMSMYLLSSDITNDLEGLSMVKIRHIPTGPTAPPLCVVPAAFYQSSPRAWRPSNMAPCRNLCERVAVRAHNGSLYDKGMKYCPKCAIFFRSDEKTHCFCCGKKLRVRTHNSRTRNRNRCSKCNRKLINFSWHDNDEQYSLICWTCATV
jgi:hypothetical protein